MKRTTLLLTVALLAGCSTIAHAQLVYPGATLPGGWDGSTSTGNSGAPATPGGGYANSNHPNGPMSMTTANPDSAVKSGVVQDTSTLSTLSTLSTRRGR